jgi:hypothetical protein
VIGKGRKMRTVYLIESSEAALGAWLDIREGMAKPEELALFISLDRAYPGGGMSARAIRYRVDSHLDRLGHASTDTTRIYACIVDKMTENPARHLETMLAA